MTKSTNRSDLIVEQAVEAHRRGYQPIPIRADSKRPYGAKWTTLRQDNEVIVREQFEQWVGEGATNIGLLLGEPSGGLIDIDLDHPLAGRLKDHLLPHTPVKTGRPTRPFSHYWYRIKGAELPGTRRYKLPDGSVTVELRSTGSQTVIPPSMHPDGEPYVWEGTPWAVPEVVEGKKLALQVALLGTVAVLLDNWPKQGSRHDAYLALAGGLLRYGEDEVNEYWEKNLPTLISSLADVTHDEDGPESRVSECVDTTLKGIREGGKIVGFPTLGRIIGDEHAQQIKRMAQEVENFSGFVRKQVTVTDHEHTDTDSGEEDSTSFIESDDPLANRKTSWEPVELEKYLSGQAIVPEPSILRREDGKGMFYPGRVNALYGRSESAKSWVALIACMQEMALGERIMYLDCEDEPAATVDRLVRLGAGDDDLRHQFTYIRPEEPHADMERSKWGDKVTTPQGIENRYALASALKESDPRLIIVDGMTVLYGLHGLDSNDASNTEVITHFLKKLTRNGRSTVIIIDHTAKNAVKGAAPLGSQHKLAMVQGSALQVVPIRQPKRGAWGYVEMVVGKDRPGGVREYATDEDIPVAAEIVLDSRFPGITKTEVKAPKGNTFILGDSPENNRELAQLAELEQSALNVFAGDLDATYSTKEIEQNITAECSTKTVRRAVLSLVNKGIVIAEGATKSRRYRLFDEDADEDDGRIHLL